MYSISCAKISLTKEVNRYILRNYVYCFAMNRPIFCMPRSQTMAMTLIYTWIVMIDSSVYSYACSLLFLEANLHFTIDVFL